MELEFVFLKGPLDIRLLYPGLIENSSLSYSDLTEVNFVTFGEDQIRVSFWEDIGWRTTELIYNSPISQQILLRTSLSSSDPSFLPVQTEYAEVEKIWKPHETLDRDEWMALMIDRNAIVGFYRGMAYVDEMDRYYSSYSYLNIRPDYRGRGLCRPFSQFAYDRLVQTLQVSYICITIATLRTAEACRCYVRAAQNLGFEVYGDNDANFPDPQEIQIADCESENFEFLIFVTQGDELDQEMISSFSQ